MNAMIPTAYETAVKKFQGELTLDSVRAYLAERAKTCRASTVALDKCALKNAVLSRVSNEQERAIIETAFRAIKTPRADVTVHGEKVLTPAQLSALVAKPKTTKRKTLIQFLATTGCRVSEALGVKILDVEVTGPTAYVRIMGKGRKERRVFIPVTLYRETREAYNGLIYLFEGTNGKPITRQYAHRIISTEGFRAGFKCHPHTLRHTFATDTLIKKGKPLTAVSKYLGHSTTAITADLYVHAELSPADLF